MVVYNAGSKELTAKIVYYGPGLGGKTTNLQFLHRRLEPSSVGNLLTLAATADRTIFFDLLPVELGELKGYRIRFQVATVPGQSPYNETRRVVLRGVDGIVFVVDSRWSMLPKNLESFQNLKDNLKEEGVSIETLPVVVQFNKRDLPDVLAVDALQEGLGLGPLPYIEAVASDGKGVVETFKLVSKLTFVDILRRLQKKGGPRGARPAADAPEISNPLHAVPSAIEFDSGPDESATRAIPVPAHAVLDSPFSPGDDTNPGVRVAAERREAIVQETFAPFPETPSSPREDTNPAFFPSAREHPAASASTTASFPAFDPEPRTAELEITSPLETAEPAAFAEAASPWTEAAPEAPPAASRLEALESRLSEIQKGKPWTADLDDLRTAVANQKLGAERGFGDLRSAVERIQREAEEASNREMELVAQISRESLGVAASLEKLGFRIQETEEKFSQLAIDQESRLSRLERLVEEQAERNLQDHEAQRRTAQEIRETLRTAHLDSEERLASFESLREALSTTLGDLAEKLRRAVKAAGQT